MMMPRRTPTALNLSLNLVGALGLALAAGSAEASAPAEERDRGAGDDDGPQARATHDRRPEPTDVAATRPDRPEAKVTPDFTQKAVPLSLPQQEADPGVAQEPSQELSQELIKPRVSKPQRQNPLDGVTADGVTAATDLPAPSLPTAPAPPQTEADLSTTNPSTPRQQPEVNVAQPAPDAADLAVAPAPRSPGAPRAQKPPPPAASSSGVVPEPAATIRPTQSSTSAGATPAPGGVRSGQSRNTVEVSLPVFVESTPGARYSARRAMEHTEIAVDLARASLARSAVAQREPDFFRPTPKKSLDLPRLGGNPGLLATDVLSVWSRFVPVPIASTPQAWSGHLPDEAIPTPTVQSPAARISAETLSHLSAAVPVAVDRVRPRAPEPMLPTFDLPRPARPGGGGLAATPPATEAQLLITQADVPGRSPDGGAALPTAAQREELLIEPLATDPVSTVRYAPSPNAGIPSAFGASWGDVFVSATLAGADRLRNEADGSLSAGFGVGNPQTAVGLELAYNLLSIRNFAENGSFDAKVHREIFSNDTTQAAAAVGWNNFVNYGDDVAGTESSVYGVVSAAHLLQPDHPTHRLPITGTLGIGGGAFSHDNADVGVLAGVGLQVDPQLSLNAAWSGVGLNVAASVAPLSEIPLTLNFLYADITNNTEAGSVAAFTVGYGFNVGPRF